MRRPKHSLRRAVEVLEDRIVLAVPLALGVGVESFALSPYAQMGGNLYFPGGAGTLWRTDGTAANTINLSNDPAYSGLRDLVVEGVAVTDGTVYFGAERVSNVEHRGMDPIPGVPIYDPLPERWKLDAAAPGGISLASGPSGTSMIAGNHRFIYAAWGDPTELLVLDSGESDPHPVASFPHAPTSYIDFSAATVAGTDLYFQVNDFSADHPTQRSAALWMSDGTSVGTKPLTGPGTSHPDLVPTEQVTVGNQLFFVAIDAAKMGELWVANGSELRRLAVFDITPSFPREWLGWVAPARYLSTDGSHALFVAPAVGGDTLWTSDGSPAGTVPLFPARFLPGDLVPQGLWLASSAGRLIYFQATTGTYGSELWKYDGTTAQLVKDIRPGPESADSSVFDVINGICYFAANDGVTGRELWATDGTADGTVRLADLNPGASGSFPENLVVVNGVILFSACIQMDMYGPYDRELWALAAPELVEVAPIKTLTTLTLAPLRASPGPSTILTATVAPTVGNDKPTGSVTFKDGERIIGTMPLDVTGTATLTTATLGPGRHAITAAYAGIGGFLGSTSPTRDTFILPPTITKLAAAPANALFGQPILLTATVTTTADDGVKPTGIVTLMDGDVNVAFAPITDEVATFNLSRPSLGRHALTAVYAGDPSSPAVRRRPSSCPSCPLQQSSASAHRLFVTPADLADKISNSAVLVAAG